MGYEENVLHSFLFTRHSGERKVESIALWDVVFHTMCSVVLYTTPFGKCRIGHLGIPGIEINLHTGTWYAYCKRIVK